MTDSSEPPAVRSVYVHAPFCASRCSYCDFAVSVSPGADLPGWLEALRFELGLLEEEGFYAPGPELDTLYVGGGTPSLLGPEAMAALADLLGRRRLGNPGLEWTAEANPESFSASLAGGWTRAGVNRLSLGVQSFDPAALRMLDRRHGAEEAISAVGIAQSAGLGNLNLDLIFGLPPEVQRDWDRDLDLAVELGAPHISLYGLSVEADTPLGKDVEAGIVSHPSEETFRTEFLRAADRLTGEGYLHYEVSNFSLPGFQSLHNRTYWELEPYVGLGNGAHSYRGGRRRWNRRDWGDYRSACSEGTPPWGGEEELGPSEVRLESIWLGLRTSKGVPLANLTPEARSLAEEWVSKGLGTLDAEGIRPNASGWLLLDELVVDMELALS
ncbi:MAG: radical SAM family heme chaperone HemW [Gemmatimonadetes bacterium]|nr:radical SAM family heme chaperone HemW [Gemmatimonadota bacterium]NNM06884.1 radical SAM family heme chaperone HemW [Gemmatimonadota bacterium]